MFLGLCMPGTSVDNLLGEILFTMYIIFTGTFDIWLEFFLSYNDTFQQMLYRKIHITCPCKVLIPFYT